MLSREERARQFMPFDALKGFNEALREKEKEYEEDLYFMSFGIDASIGQCRESAD